MKVSIEKKCPDFNSYRAACVKSMFNAETGNRFSLEVELPIEEMDWNIGLVVGPSGSGKSSLGSEMFQPEAYHTGFDWPNDAPVIDAIKPKADMNQVTAALAAVGLGSVPSWLRPYHVLSTGEKFRAESGPHRMRGTKKNRDRRVHFSCGSADSQNRRTGICKSLAQNRRPGRTVKLPL